MNYTLEAIVTSLEQCSQTHEKTYECFIESWKWEIINDIFVIIHTHTHTHDAMFLKWWNQVIPKLVLVILMENAKLDNHATNFAQI